MTNTEKPDAPAPENAESDSGLYRALLSHYVHQDRLLWSRVQLLIAIQGAVLAGSYSLRDHWLAFGILLAGSVITILLILLVEKDQRDRDMNLGIMDILGHRLLPADLREQPILMTSSWIIRGRWLLRIVLWAFVVLDVILFVLYLCNPGLFPTRAG